MLLNDSKMTVSSTNILIKPLSFTENQIFVIKQHLSSMAWCAFLESANDQHIDSKWSIFTAAPIATMQKKDQLTLVTNNLEQSTDQHNEDPLQIQQSLRQQLFHPEHIQDYPFTGGVIAAYDYEMGEQFETLQKRDNGANKQQGDHYSCAFYDWAILYHLQTQQYYLVQHHYRGATESLDQLWQQRNLWLEKLSQQQTSNNEHFCLNTDWQKDYSKDEYKDAFQSIQEYILSGDCYQINFAQRLHAPYQGNEFAAYQSLLISNQPPFAAFIRLPKKVLISMSPERLLQLKSGQIQTKPIKGTMPRSTDIKVDQANKQQLSASTKDQAENLMIVDLLRNDIGKVSEIGSVAVPKLFDIESFPAVHHLVSTVTGKLDKQYSSEDLMRACFPGGSITGAPKIRAMEVINELEKYAREIYCGSIAYINGNGDMDSSITIRTLVCRDNIIYCWGGGGIVADSIMEKEYQECFDKLSKILPALTVKSSSNSVLS